MTSTILFSKVDQSVQLYLRELKTPPSCPKASYVQPNMTSPISHQSLSGLPNLTSVDLGYNSITFLPEGFFDQNPKLEKVVLAYNPINSLAPSTFRRLGSLSHLDLTYLNLKSVHSDLFSYNRCEGTGWGEQGAATRTGTLNIWSCLLIEKFSFTADIM